MSLHEQYIKDVKAWADSLVGTPQKEAEQSAAEGGYQYRTVNRDGKPFITTRDYVPDRLNLTVVDGIVTAIHLG